MTREEPRTERETLAAGAEEIAGEQTPAPAPSAATKRREADAESARVRRSVIAAIIAR